MVIHLISGPRNISTALMYAFAQRPDTTVLDEPFYGFYLQHTGLPHPGREDILSTMERDPEKIFQSIRQSEEQKGHVFVKNMGHHLQGYDYNSIKAYTNVFLIRDPGQMLASYVKVHESPTLDDIGLKFQAELYDWLVAEGQQPVVIDGNEVRKNPEATLSKLCAAIGLPFAPEMLCWPAGPKAEDGVWAPYWYSNVHRSTGFIPPDDETFSLPPEIKPVYEAALPYYYKLKEKTIWKDAAKI
jgi:hypothetical protein